MSDRTTAQYAESIHAIAAAEGRLAEVEDELFRFAQALEGNDALRSALIDKQLPVSGRQQVIEDLLGGKASPATIGAISMVVAAGRAGELLDIARAVLDRGAELRDHAVAEVRSAVPLTDDQQSRLVTALKKSTGKDVEIKVVIDPSVLGGVITQIGDTVIDGSLRNRLNKVRESLT
jgi:F-type H+-transporting ATPase subunit delta